MVIGHGHSMLVISRMDGPGMTDARAKILQKLNESSSDDDSSEDEKGK